MLVHNEKVYVTGKEINENNENNLADIDITVFKNLCISSRMTPNSVRIQRINFLIVFTNTLITIICINRMGNI